MTKRILALLLALTMVFSVLPTGYALDSGSAGQGNDRKEVLPGAAEGQSDPPPASEEPEGRHLLPSGNQRAVLNSWDFETDPAAVGWTFVDSDGDGHNWLWSPSIENNTIAAYEGSNMLVSQSYINGTGALTPNNWAVTPAFDLSAATEAYFTFYAKGQDASWPSEVFAIYAGTSPNVSEMTKLSQDYTATAEWTQYSAALTDFIGEGTVYAAIRHYNVTDLYFLDVDLAQILSGAPGEDPTDPTDPTEPQPLNACGDALSWSLDDATGVLTVTGTGDMYDYSIETPAPWYDQRGSITALSLPEGLSSIGAYAFYNCTGLTTVVVPDSVQTIGAYAFARCIYLKSLTLPAGLTAISPYMLYMTYYLKTVVVPAAVTEIGDYAFASNAVYSLDRLVFRGPQPTTVGENVFENRGSEICIGYDPAHADSWAPNGETSWRGYPLMPVLPEGVCGENLSWSVDESALTLTITGTGPMYDFNGASPAPWCDDYENIYHVVVGEGVTTLGELAFAGCSNINDFALPDSLVSIGCRAFYKTNVHTLNLPASLQSFDLTDLQSHGRLAVINVALRRREPLFLP